LKLGITMLIHNKDDIEFVTEFPCFLGHPVFGRQRLPALLESTRVYTLQFPTKDDTWKKEKVFNKKKLGLIFLPLNKIYYLHGQPSSTFEFLSRVNLSGPSLYCVGRKLGKESRHSILAGATMLTRSDFRLNFFLQEGQRCVLGAWCYRQ